MGQAGWPNPSKTGPQDPETGGRIHQFLWRVSQPVTMRMRDLAARGDEKPLRVGSSSAGWFRACVNRSYPEGIRLLLCASTGRTALAVPETGSAKRKDAERRDKVSVRTGKDTRAGQAP